MEIEVQQDAKAFDKISLKEFATDAFIKKSLKEFEQELKKANAPKEVLETLAKTILENLHELIERSQKNTDFIYVGQGWKLLCEAVEENTLIMETLNSYLDKFNVLCEQDKELIKSEDAYKNSILFYLLILKKDEVFKKLLIEYESLSGDVLKLLLFCATQDCPCKQVLKILKYAKIKFTKDELELVKQRALVYAGYKSLYAVNALNMSFDLLIKEYIDSTAQK